MKSGPGNTIEEIAEVQGIFNADVVIDAADELLVNLPRSGSP